MTATRTTVPAGGARQAQAADTRAKLVQATIELLGESGTKAVTHRGVARRAGLKDAITAYHYPSVAELLEAAVRELLARRTRQVEAVLRSAITVGGGLVGAVGHVAEYHVDHAAAPVIAEFEFLLAAARDERLGPVVAEAMDHWQRVTVAAVRHLGVRDPEVAAERFLAVLDGYALHRVARRRPRDLEVELLRDALLALFTEQVLDPATLEAAHGELEAHARRLADRKA